MGILWLLADYQELQIFKICYLNAEQSDTALLCTTPSAKICMFMQKLDKHRNINLYHTPQSTETQQALNSLCEECKDIFLPHQGDIGHIKLLTMDIDAGDHPTTAQK